MICNVCKQEITKGFKRECRECSACNLGVFSRSCSCSYYDEEVDSCACNTCFKCKSVQDSSLQTFNNHNYCKLCYDVVIKIEKICDVCEMKFSTYPHMEWKKSCEACFNLNYIKDRVMKVFGSLKSDGLIDEIPIFDLKKLREVCIITRVKYHRKLTKAEYKRIIECIRANVTKEQSWIYAIYEN